MDPLCFERGQEALHGRIIETVAPPAHRLLDAMPLQHRPIRPSGILGGFKWSSQHLDGGGCDEGWETPLGSGATSRVAAVAWPTRRGGGTVRIPSTSSHTVGEEARQLFQGR